MTCSFGAESVKPGSWRTAWSCQPGNAALSAWLRDRGSLTARLQQRGEFSIRLLRQNLARPFADEAEFFALPAHSLVWVREVALYCDGEAVVFAHTVLPCRPRGALTRWMARLGSRSLGALLFSHAGFRRGAMEFRRLDTRHPLFSRARAALGEPQSRLWARRSAFTFGAQSVLVSEVFSPRLLRD